MNLIINLDFKFYYYYLIICDSDSDDTKIVIGVLKHIYWQILYVYHMKTKRRDVLRETEKIMYIYRLRKYNITYIS